MLLRFRWIPVNKSGWRAESAMSGLCLKMYQPSSTMRHESSTLFFEMSAEALRTDALHCWARAGGQPRRSPALRGRMALCIGSYQGPRIPHVEHGRDVT
ncbi:unnamed protein product, partial [Cladocopium goreaui]